MKKTKQYYEAFENCLNQVFSDNETIDTVLVQYPEFADQLRPELEAALWIYRRREAINMRPGYLTASRQRLVNQIKKEDESSRSQKKTFWTKQQMLFQVAFVALFLVVSTLAYFGGAQVVSTSLPGDPLYNAKLAVEDFQLSLASDASREADLRIELADRRAREAASLLEQERYQDAEVALEGYRKNLTIAVDLIQEIKEDPGTQVALAQKLASTVTKHNENFAVYVTAVTAAKIPDETIFVLSSIMVMNDEITQTIVILIDEFDELPIPVQESLTVTASITPTSTPTPSQTPTSTFTASPEPSETAEPSLTPTSLNGDLPEPSDTPAPNNTPLPVKPTDADSDDPEPTKIPTKTPKPEKPTKTPKPVKPTKTPKDK